MLPRKILGLGGLAISVLGFFFKEALAGIVGSFAEKMLNPSLLAGGQFVTFTLADVLLGFLLLISMSALFWPWISKKLQTEIERKSLTVGATKRRVFVDLHFPDESDALFLSREFKPILVDCTFSCSRLAFSDCVFDDGFRLEPKYVTFCTHDELAAIGLTIPLLSRARLINSPIYTEHIFLTEQQAHAIFGSAQIKGLTPLDPSFLTG